MKKKIGILMVLCLMFSNIVAFAAEDSYKDESIYGILNDNGSVSSLYVVNAVHGSSIDFGNYETIENLVSLDELAINEGMVVLPTYQDTFYYQGTLEEYEMPWDFKITYKLDEHEISVNELAGAEGNLSISISTNKGATSKEYFFENYALQISLALSNDLCTEVIAEGATIVEAGGAKQIAFTVLPNNSADYIITAKVKDFVMDPVTVNAVNMVFNLDVDTSAFTDQLGELSAAVAELDNGASELLKGIDKLSSGLISYNKGLNEYRTGMMSFADGGAYLFEGMDGLSNGLSSLKNQNEALSSGLSALEESTFNQINMQLDGTGLPELDRGNYQAVLGGQDAFSPYLIQLEQILQLIDGLNGYLGGVGELSDGAADLSEGMNTYVESAYALEKYANDLYNGAVSFNDGLKAYRNGVAEYKNGTAKFKKSTGGIDSDIESTMDNLLNDFTGDKGDLVSFVSEKNTNIESVQFFFRTNPIEKEEIIEADEIDTKEYNFWDRLLQLFGF